MMDLRWRWLFFVIILEILSQTAEGMFIFHLWCYNNDNLCILGNGILVGCAFQCMTGCARILGMAFTTLH